MFPTASPFVTLGITGIVVAVAVGAVALFGLSAARLGKDRAGATRRAALVVLAWGAVTGSLAASGILLRFDLLPPPFVVLFVTLLALGVATARSRVGLQLATGLPLWTLVLFQSFRLPLELVMRVAGAEGTMPDALSVDGENFDVLTGTSAIALGLTLKVRTAPLPLWVVHAWNVLGIAALVNIARIALLSSPLVAHYGPDQLNLWVAYVPFVWLPAILVVAAVAGHGIVLRRLLADGKVPAAPADRADLADGGGAARVA